MVPARGRAGPRPGHAQPGRPDRRHGERPADYAAAARWFEQAAERGLSDSQFNLAVLYENGRGVPKDLPEAYKWFALAARGGDQVAARRLEQVKAQLEPAELEAAERKLAAWRPRATEQITGSIGARASTHRRSAPCD